MTVSDDDHYACNPDTCNVAAASRSTSAELHVRARNEARLVSQLGAIADILGADPADLDELPDLVHGLTTARGQLADALQRSGAAQLAYDHLAAATRTLVERVAPVVGRPFLAPTASTREAVITVRRVLRHDPDSYLTEPYDDPDTRIDLTAVARDLHQARMERDWLLAEAPDTLRTRFFAIKAKERRAASVPRTARVSSSERPVDLRFGVPSALAEIDRYEWPPAHNGHYGVADSGANPTSGPL